MSRNNETKLAGVQVVGYGHPTIYVIEDVKAGAVAVMVSGKPWQSPVAEAMSSCLEGALARYIKDDVIRWAKGRPVRYGNQLVMPKPVVHPSQEAFVKAVEKVYGVTRNQNVKTPDVSAGFGQAVIDQAALDKGPSDMQRVAMLEDEQQQHKADLKQLRRDMNLLRDQLGQVGRLAKRTWVRLDNAKF